MKLMNFLLTNRNFGFIIVARFFEKGVNEMFFNSAFYFYYFKKDCSSALNF